MTTPRTTTPRKKTSPTVVEPTPADAPEPVSVSNDVDTLAPDLDHLTLHDGFEVAIQKLRTRQIFRLLKIITKGASENLQLLQFEDDATIADYTERLIVLLLVAVPDAEDEAVDFIKSMVIPANLIEQARSKDDKQRNLDAFQTLDEALDNPELDDLINIISLIIRREAENIVSLGKQITEVLRVQMAALSISTPKSRS